jgi:hypothetical protein
LANSLSTDWDKFYAMVMGEPAPRAETPIRVTPEGLNVYQRPVVSIDSSGNPVPSHPLPAISSFGPPQGTKNNRGSLPSAGNSLSEPWGGTIDQFMLPRRDIIQNVPPLPQTRTATVNASDPLNVNNLGLTRQSFFAKQETPAERAIAEVTIKGGSPQGPWKGWGSRPSPSLPTMADPNDDPLLAEALKIGRAYKPSAKVQAALNAPAPSGSPGAPQQQRGGGLLGMLLGAFGGGSTGQGGGLASILSGGGPATGQQLAAMQQAAQTAQDPALAQALAAGNKTYTPTNGDPTGVLGYGALMPTVAMNGNPIRNR